MNVVFVLAVVAFFVTTFWDKIKEWNVNSRITNPIRYFLAAAVASYGVYSLGLVDSVACGTTFGVLGFFLLIAVICIAIDGWEKKTIEALIKTLLILIPILMAILLFIFGGGISGFYTIATLGLVLLLIPKKS